MRTFIAVLIFIVLLPAAISNPERTRLVTLSPDTVTLREVRRASEIAAVTELGDSPETLLVHRIPLAAVGGTPMLASDATTQSHSQIERNCPF